MNSIAFTLLVLFFTQVHAYQSANANTRTAVSTGVDYSTEVNDPTYAPQTLDGEQQAGESGSLANLFIRLSAFYQAALTDENTVITIQNTISMNLNSPTRSTKWKVKKLLGWGTFGVVVQAENPKSGMQRAIKIMPQLLAGSDILPKEKLEKYDFLKGNVLVYNKCFKDNEWRCPNVTRIFHAGLARIEGVTKESLNDYFEAEDIQKFSLAPYAVVLELAQASAEGFFSEKSFSKLSSTLRSNVDKPLYSTDNYYPISTLGIWLNAVMQYLVEVESGLNQLSALFDDSPQLVHHDLKPGNVNIFTGSGKVVFKLSDFDTVREVGTKHTNLTTPDYNHPLVAAFGDNIKSFPGIDRFSLFTMFYETLDLGISWNKAIFLGSDKDSGFESILPFKPSKENFYQYVKDLPDMFENYAKELREQSSSTKTQPKVNQPKITEKESASGLIDNEEGYQNLAVEFNDLNTTEIYQYTMNAILSYFVSELRQPNAFLVAAISREREIPTTSEGQDRDLTSTVSEVTGFTLWKDNLCSALETTELEQAFKQLEKQTFDKRKTSKWNESVKRDDTQYKNLRNKLSLLLGRLKVQFSRLNAIILSSAREFHPLYLKNLKDQTAFEEPRNFTGKDLSLFNKYPYSQIQKDHQKILQRFPFGSSRLFQAYIEKKNSP